MDQDRISHIWLVAAILIGWCVCLCAPSRLTLCDPLDCSPPLFTGFSRQEYRSGLPFPTPGCLPNAGIKLESPSFRGWFFATELPGDTPALNHDLFLENKPVVNCLPLWLRYRILQNCVSVGYLTFCSLLSFLISYIYLPSKIIE